jgi:DNA repair exonuclease SbcCD nuclease subunit
MEQKLIKTAAFTDIHWGAKANSLMHNEDCMRYIEWFCDNIKNDSEIDNIIFLGDWFENRSAINVSTMKYAYHGLQKINELGLPIYFIIGNHDLYYRHSRDIHSITSYGEFANLTIIDEPTTVNEIHNGVLISPYLFDQEYEGLKNYIDLDTWWGHFEFKGFVVTGYNVTMPTGPDSNEYIGPKYIFSGHFHKRQARDQIVYIGNAFPTNFGDAGDSGRGMMIYNHKNQDAEFKDWEDCPRYIKTTLSEILETPESRKNILHPQARVKCVVDIPISFEESTYLREKFMVEFDLREFSMEESQEIRQAMTETESDIDWDNTELTSVNDLVLRMLNDIDTPHIDNEKLVSIYKNLKPQ